MKGIIFIFAVLVIMSISAFSSYAVTAADPDIAAAWLFDEDEGDMVTDLSENGNTGEVIGNVTWIEDGKFGGALSFEGNISWISVPDHPSLQFKQGQDFTLALYIKTEVGAGNPPMLLAKNYQPAQVLPWYALYYANQAKALDGHVSIFLRDDGGASFNIAGETLINDNEWHHVVGLREGDTMKLYVDGVEEANMGGVDFDVGTNEAPLHINGHLDRWLIAVFDEVIMFKRALTDAEITKLVNNGIDETFMSVSSRGKLASLWGKVKSY